VKQKRWVIIRKGWYLRSNQDGLELVGPEHNISLEFANPGIYRKRIASILCGFQMIPQNQDNQGIVKMIENLSMQGILQYQNCRSQESSTVSKMEQIIWKLRNTFVGSRGPISTVYRLDFNEPKLSASKSYLFAARYTPCGETEKEWAGGADEDSSVAELKAIMEALERWASGVIPEEKILKCSSQKLGARALNPEQGIAYAQWQYQQKGFPCTPFSTTREYFWKEVTTFPGEKTYYLPVECLYYPVARKFAPAPYTFTNSSGVAAAFSFEEALTGGIYEAMERDAFMLTWLNGLERPRIRKTTLPGKEQRKIREFEKLGYTMHLVDLTIDLAPVVLAIAVSHTQEPSLLLGAASHFNLLDAISKALREIEYQFYWRLRHADYIRVIKNAKEVRSVLDHMALYASQKHLAKAKFLWQGTETSYRETPFVSKKQALERLIELLESSGKTLVITDLTPPSLKKMGIWVVRSIPLGLIPVSFGYGMEPLGMSRIYEISGKRRNWIGKAFTHPFA